MSDSLHGELAAGNLLGSATMRHRSRVDDRTRPFLRPLLRQVMASAPEHTVLIGTGEFLRMMRRARVHSVGVAVDRDRGNHDLGCGASMASIGA